MSSLAITSVQTRSESGSLMAAAVGFYFATRYSTEYLFFQSNPRAGAGFSVGLNILLLAVVLFHSLGPTPNTLRSTVSVPCFRSISAFLLFALLSLVWSATISVPVAFAYWCCVAADLAMVVLLLRTGPVDVMSYSLMKGYVWGAGFIAVIIWASPTMQDLRPGNDDFFSPNAIALICALGAFLAQFLGRSNRLWNVAAVLLAITLLRTLSKTTIIAFTAGEALLLFRDAAITRRKLLTILLGAGVVVAAFWRLIQAYFEVYTTTGNQAETLTGRVGVWDLVWERSLEQPWIGHGFHSFRNVIPNFGPFEPWHAHNELLQLFYAYGAVGILLFFMVYGSFYLQIRRLRLSSYKAFFYGVLLFIVIRGLADTDRFELTLPFGFLFLFSSLMMHLNPPQLESLELSTPTKDGQS
ncbi:MAG: O-antigen ligase family protein [Acidobacteriaceae bacterium]